MKAVMAGVLVAVAVLCSPVAKAWSCTVPGQVRVQVPSGTTGVYGDGSGQLSASGGLLFECETLPTGGGSTNTNSNTNQNVNQNSNSSSSKSNSSSSSNNSNVNIAEGGKGGSVSNSGNSSVKNTVTTTVDPRITVSPVLTNKQNQSQSQSITDSGNSSSTSAADNAGNVQEFTENIPHQAPTAVAPTVFPTASCFKSTSGGASWLTGGVSFGGGKIDENCAILEAARLARSQEAFCKVYLSNKYVHRAGVTMADCMAVEVKGKQ